MQTTANPPITMARAEITFPRGMLGWVGAIHFVLEPVGDDGIFAVLRCTDTVRLKSGPEVPSPTFLVAPPSHFAPRYQVMLDDAFAESLGLSEPEDAALLAIITQRQPIEHSTVNLFSPLVVNRQTWVADQFVPSGREDNVGWRVRTPVMPVDDEVAGQGGGSPC